MAPVSNDPSCWTHLLRKSVAAIAVRGLSAAVQLVSVLAIGRLLGPELLGQYSFYFAAMALMSVVTSVGSPRYVLAVNARHFKKRDMGALGGVLAGVFLRVGQGTLLVVGAAMLLGPLFDAHIDYGVLMLLAVAAFLNGLTMILAENLKAMDQPYTGNVLERGALQILATCSLLMMALAGDANDPHHAAWSLVGAALLTTLLAVAVTHREPGMELDWRAPAVPLSALRGYFGARLLEVVAMRGSILLAGAMLSLAETGAIQALIVFGSIGTIIDNALGSITGPHISRAAETGDRGHLRRVVLQSQLLRIALSLPGYALMALMAEFLLGLINESFRIYADSLLLVIAGRVIQSACGQTTFVLDMLHKPIGNIYALLVSIAVLGAFSLVLIGQGVAGLALAIGASYAALGLAGFFFVRMALR